MKVKEIKVLLERALPDERIKKEILQSFNSLQDNEDLKDYELSRVVRNLAYNSVWIFAEKIADFIKDKDERLQALAYTADKMAIAGKLDESLRLLKPTLQKEQDWETKLVQLEALHQIINSFIKSNEILKATNYLIILEDELLKVQLIHTQQAERIAAIAEFWILLGNKKRAFELLKIAVDIANQYLKLYGRKGRMRREVRQTYHAIFTLILRNKENDIVNKLVKYIDDIREQKQIINFISDFS